MKPTMSAESDTYIIENEALVLDMVEWIARQPRSYSDVMEAWRTSCPRLAVWEAAVELQLVVRLYRQGFGATVEVTPAGAAFLSSRGRVPQ